MASDESDIGTLPIVSLLEDVDAYASKVFDLSAKTIKDLQRVEQLKSNRGQVTDWKTLGEREILLVEFLHEIEEVQKDLTDMRTADWPALSLVWGNGSGEFYKQFSLAQWLIHSQSLLGKQYNFTSP